MDTVDENYKLSEDEDDVSILVEILSPVRHSWEEIAVALNLPVGTRAQYDKKDFTIALTNVLKAWASGKGGKNITLGKLRKVLAGPIVAFPELADKLIPEFNKAKKSK